MSPLEQAIRIRTAGGRRRLPRPPRLLPPLNIEKAYERELVRVMYFLHSVIDRSVKPRLRGLVDDATAWRPEPSRRRDNAADDFIDLLDDTRVQVTQTWSEADVETLAERYGVQTSDYNRMQQLRAVKRVVGVDVFAAEPWLRHEIAAFAVANRRLIQSAVSRTTNDIETGILRGFQRGTRWENLVSFIDGRLEVGENHARLIARDQINKLNGQLTMLRQTSLGIRRAIWRTSMDERVRESHQEMEGEEFAWDDLPVVDGEQVAPGEPIKCRCWAEPVFEGVER